MPLKNSPDKRSDGDSDTFGYKSDGFMFHGGDVA